VHKNLTSEVVLNPDLNPPKRVRPAPTPPPDLPFVLPEDTRPNLSEPTVLELAGNFGAAMSKWFAAGMPVVSEAEYQRRTSICDGCNYWDPWARLGLGKCKAPGCGCTSLKRWLATERCMHPEGSRWELT